jgi:hypothetical protein
MGVYTPILIKANLGSEALKLLTTHLDVKNQEQKRDREQRRTKRKYENGQKKSKKAPKKRKAGRSYC